METGGKTIVWITGAATGLGSGLARTVPYKDARVINISRRPHPELESLQADLTDPTSWDTIAAHLADELARFDGRRAVFVHNAFVQPPVGFVGEVDRDEYRRHVLGNVAAPIILGDAFLRAVRTAPPELESGLVMISSATARVPFAGRAAYGAGKAAMEQWVRTVRSEREHRGRGPWVVAVRPGTVDSPSLRADAAADPAGYPVAPSLVQVVANGTMESPEVAARRIWEILPPGPDTPPIVLFGDIVPPPRAGGPLSPSPFPQ